MRGGLTLGAPRWGDFGPTPIACEKPMAHDEWELIADYPVTTYANGIQAGDRVRLRKQLVIRDHQGKATGIVHEAGDEWTVLSGTADEPDLIWLRQPDGDRHTWDVPSFPEWFEVVASTSRIS